MTSAEPPGGVYALTAGPGDLGQRVVVRHRLPEGGYADLLGELVRWDEQVVAVRDRHGTERSCAPADVVAAKRVPPPPAPRS